MTLDRQDFIDLATKHIGADAYEPRGLHIYLDHATGENYLVDSDDMEKLGRMLDAKTHSAYSHWCNQTTAEEVNLAAVAIFAEDCDDLDTLEAEAGSADDMPTFMALRFRRDELADLIRINAEIAAEEAEELEDIGVAIKNEGLKTSPQLPLVSPSGWWWLSFAGEEGFRGGLIMHGGTIVDATASAAILGLNPGGEVQGIPIKSIDSTPDEWRRRLLTRSECEELDQLLLRSPAAFAWVSTDQETYEQRRDCLPPACNMARPNMFLLGEAADHNAEGQPVFHAHLRDSDGWWAGSHPVTLAEFSTLAARPVAAEVGA